METCCRGGAGEVGAVCANAGAAKPRSPRSAQNVGWARFALPTLRRLHRVQNSIINYHAPWNATYRNRNRGLAGPQIDNGDIVAEAVGDIKRLFVARHAEAPGALPDQDVALNLTGRYVNHGDVGGGAQCHIGGL